MGGGAAKLVSRCVRGMNEQELKTSGVDALSSLKNSEKAYGLGGGGIHPPPLYVRGLTLIRVMCNVARKESG